MITLGTYPPRVDLVVHAGEPISFSIPVLDDAGAAVSSLLGWTPAAQVRTAPDGPVLATFAAVIVGNAVRVDATPGDTGTWSETWPTRTGQWDLVLTHSTGATNVLCRGWVRLFPTISQ